MSYQYAQLKLHSHPALSDLHPSLPEGVLDVSFVSFSDTDEGFRADVLNHLVGLKKFAEEARAAQDTDIGLSGDGWTTVVKCPTDLPQVELVNWGRIAEVEHVNLIDACVDQLAYLRALATVKSRWQYEQRREEVVTRGDAGRVAAVKNEDISLVVKHTQRLHEELKRFFQSYHLSKGGNVMELVHTLNDSLDMSPIT